MFRSILNPTHLLCAALLAIALMTLSSAASAQWAAGNWFIFQRVDPQPSCIVAPGLAISVDRYMTRVECAAGAFNLSPEPAASTVVQMALIDPDGTVKFTQTTTWDTVQERWEFDWDFDAGYIPGIYTIRVTSVAGTAGNFGEHQFELNALGAVVTAGTGLEPGDPIPVSGRIYEIDEVPSAGIVETDVPASFTLVLVDPGGVELHSEAITAGADGTFSTTIPGSATTGIVSSQPTITLGVRAVDATYNDPGSGAWAAEDAGGTGVTLNVAAPSLVLENSFVSSVGWVKPGELYPFRLFVRNFTGAAATNVSVTIPNVDGTTFVDTIPVGATSGSAAIDAGGIEWTIASLPSGATATLVANAQAHTPFQDPQIVWKDLSTTATLTADGETPQVSQSLGPKVIPPIASYDSARFGFRPFPVVPADYRDRKHQPNNSGQQIEAKINSPDVPGSVFNLWQEMSFGQLSPHAAVPSADIASADFTVDWNNPNRTNNNIPFQNGTPNGACQGTTAAAVQGTPLYAERIVNGWYQLPGDTNYYGGDQAGFITIAGALTPAGPIGNRDDACGPRSKAVYDSAAIADPEIDYNLFDTDKDGVVDFFMLLFVGCGGNGPSQALSTCSTGSVPPYDNIWPHSSSLEFFYRDATTGQRGYVSDDQLTDLEGKPQCWIDTGYSGWDTCGASGGTGDDALPVYVAVGPYNVNPETSIAQASVISHEYGHSLGLPDFYGSSGVNAYNDYNLMATDKSQHMDVFGKQEMGWIVPKPIEPGSSVTINEWQESKIDTGQIEWEQADGTPYTLSAANGHQNIHNAETYVVKLPARKVIDEAKVANDASPAHVWFSGAGNDFGCVPTGGHNLDFWIPEAKPGDTVELSFKSYFDIEWDWDYGFFLVSYDAGETYAGLASQHTTESTFNPNNQGCLNDWGRGLTGTSASYQAGTETADRLNAVYDETSSFIPDSVSFTVPADANGSEPAENYDDAVFRFSYFTDAAFVRPGWFIDDLVITVNGTEVYNSDFETHPDMRIFPGGCRHDGSVADICTAGWSRISASLGSAQDHAYYMEMRERSGFDFNGKGENNRSALNFDPGLLLVYTDEQHGYGNVGESDHPNQTPVDSTPQPGVITPTLTPFRPTQPHYDDTSPNYVDSYRDPHDPLGENRFRHNFGCMTLDVLSMVGHTTVEDTLPGDLVGNVQISTAGIAGADGVGCAPFKYWPDTDFDEDTIIDVLDNCPEHPNTDQLDSDGDSVGDACDNCTVHENGSQCDTNDDGYGNRCDADLDNNGIVNSFDLQIMRGNFGASGRNDADLNCDGSVNSFDLQIMRDGFGGNPGPSAFNP